jgi:ZIP family zinc transporter
MIFEYIIGMSALAGVCGTGLGGLMTALLGSRTDKMISYFLSFAGGIMTSIVFFGLIPEAELHSDTVVVITGLVAGMILVFVLNYLLDKISNADRIKSKLHETYKEYFHESEMITCKKNMIRSGMLMFFVIGLHNIPEGLAIGTSAIHDIGLGTTFTLIIAIHNIPEGMAISAPLISGGLKKGKTVLLTSIAGIPTILGAFVGILIGNISDMVFALSFSVAGGAMLYVVFCEILPQTTMMNKDRVPMIVLLVGIIFGLILTKI